MTTTVSCSKSYYIFSIEIQNLLFSNKFDKFWKNSIYFFATLQNIINPIISFPISSLTLKKHCSMLIKSEWKKFCANDVTESSYYGKSAFKVTSQIWWIGTLCVFFCRRYFFYSMPSKNIKLYLYPKTLITVLLLIRLEN